MRTSSHSLVLGKIYLPVPILGFSLRFQQNGLCKVLMMIHNDKCSLSKPLLPLPVMSKQLLKAKQSKLTCVRPRSTSVPASPVYSHPNIRKEQCSRECQGPGCQGTCPEAPHNFQNECPRVGLLQGHVKHTWTTWSWAWKSSPFPPGSTQGDECSVLPLPWSETSDEFRDWCGPFALIWDSQHPLAEFQLLTNKMSYALLLFI